MSGTNCIGREAGDILTTVMMIPSTPTLPVHLACWRKAFYSVAWEAHVIWIENFSL